MSKTQIIHHREKLQISASKKLEIETVWHFSLRDFLILHRLTNRITNNFKSGPFFIYFILASVPRISTAAWCHPKHLRLLLACICLQYSLHILIVSESFALFLSHRAYFEVLSKSCSAHGVCYDEWFTHLSVKCGSLSQTLWAYARRHTLAVAASGVMRWDGLQPRVQPYRTKPYVHLKLIPFGPFEMSLLSGRHVVCVSLSWHPYCINPTLCSKW